MALHEPGWVCGSQTGSRRLLTSRWLLEPFLGVMVSMSCPSVNASPAQQKWASRSPGARTWRAPTMKRRCALSRAARLVAESMPAPVDDDELFDTVSGLEGLHHRDDRGGLSLVPLPAADLERKTTAVDQQPDDDLGVDPPLFGVADLAQVVLTLGLEIERGHVIPAQGQPPHWR